MPALTPTAPPSNPGAQGPCTKLLTALPIQLGELAGRIVHPKPDSPFVVAWGDPAVVLRCGVVRPDELQPGSSGFVPVVNGVAFFEKNGSATHVYTAIDRAAYIEVSVPNAFAAGPLPQLASAIAKVLPAVCVPQAGPGEPAPNPQTLCVNRP